MTRIRKLFLGTFLMVFTLGIGVFIFVQVDSKDAGTANIFLDIGCPNGRNSCCFHGHTHVPA